MRILLASPAFFPRVGGLETVTALLAGEFSRRGHEVAVLTETESDRPDTFPFRVVRRPGPLARLRLVRWSDVFFQANVSLRGLWPLFLVRRPWVVSHHSWYCRTDGRIAWQDRLKRSLIRRAAASIAVSRAMAEDLGGETLVITNPYQDDLFRLLPGVERTVDLAFLGRLVSDKGADLLLEALGLLAAQGLRPCLTVIGDGPELPFLQAQAVRLGLTGQIEWVGTETGEALVHRLNRHRILVVPSRYNEPFGIVALEGIACGCVVAGSAGGGLAEAIGACGRTFQNGDVAGLAAVLTELVSHPEGLDAFRRPAAAHLAGHTRERIGDLYLQVLDRVRVHS